MGCNPLVKHNPILCVTIPSLQVKDFIEEAERSWFEFFDPAAPHPQAYAPFATGAAPYAAASVAGFAFFSPPAPFHPLAQPGIAQQLAHQAPISFSENPFAALREGGQQLVQAAGANRSSGGGSSGSSSSTDGRVPGSCVADNWQPQGPRGSRRHPARQTAAGPAGGQGQGRAQDADCEEEMGGDEAGGGGGIQVPEEIRGMCRADRHLDVLMSAEVDPWKMSRWVISSRILLFECHFFGCKVVKERWVVGMHNRGLAQRKIWNSSNAAGNHTGTCDM